jgi:hypothetical protein
MVAYNGGKPLTCLALPGAREVKGHDLLHEVKWLER